MAEVTGPISTLPGAVHRLPEGATCDDCGKPATRRVQGETDSFGCEMVDLCDSCLKADRERVMQGRCDWCHADAQLSPVRDPDEGMCGPVYYVCSGCRSKHNDARAREAAEYDDDVLAGW